MGSFLPWRPDSPQDNSDHFSSLFRSSSSSNSSLSSQSSLPSIPSLTLPLSKPSIHHRCLSTIRGHSSYIFSLALAGNRLFSGASDGQIRAWEPHDSINFTDNSSSYCTNVVEGCSAVKAILVAGEKIITAHHDHKIRVWKIANCGAGGRWKPVAVLPTLKDRCMRLFSAGNYVRIRRHKRRTWVHHVDAVSSLALSQDFRVLYSVSWDRTLKIWRTSDYKCLESVQNAHDDAINAVAVAAGFVYTASADKTIKVWRIGAAEKKHSLVATLEKHKSAVNALALGADGDVLYSGACDRSIIVWQKDSGGKMAVAGALRGHTKAILCLATVSDLVCSGSADRTVRVWRRSESGSYSCLAAFEGHRSPVKCLAAAAAGEDDGKIVELGNEFGNSYLIYSGGLDFEIRVWQIWVPSHQIN